MVFIRYYIIYTVIGSTRYVLLRNTKLDLDVCECVVTFSIYITGHQPVCLPILLVVVG